MVRLALDEEFAGAGWRPAIMSSYSLIGCCPNNSRQGFSIRPRGLSLLAGILKLLQPAFALLLMLM